MTTFKIDLKTKFISEDTNVYLARAGKQGHLFDQVKSTKAIGPDLPNLEINLQKDFKKGGRLLEKIERSRKLSQWLRTSEKYRGDKPKRNLANYDQKRSGHAQIDAIVQTYFKDMKAGDVLIIPDPKLFGEAILAEILPIEDVLQVIPGAKRFEGYDFQGRKFGHVKMVRMLDLPRSIIELARAPTGLAKIGSAPVKKKIFELCYTDYSFDDLFSSQIITTKPEFRPFDATVLNAFVRMVAQNVELLQTEGEDAQLLSLSDAAFVMGQDHGLSVKININSRGHLSVIDQSVKPLVVGAVLGVLATVGFDGQAFAQDAVVIKVTNSRVESALDLCSEEVGRLTQSMLRFMPEADFRQACDLLRQTHETTGAESNVSVNKK